MAAGGEAAVSAESESRIALVSADAERAFLVVRSLELEEEAERRRLPPFLESSSHIACSVLSEGSAETAA